jgi:hypothetical protein
MNARAIPMESITLPSADPESFRSQKFIVEYEYLLDLANDIYVATLETPVVGVNFVSLML